MAIIYTNQSSGRKHKSASKKLAQARLEHAGFLLSLGIVPSKRRAKPAPVYNFPDLSVKSVAPTSDNLYVGGGYKRTIDDYKWRKDQAESKETIKAIEQKRKRIAPIYNKGPAAYIVDGEDLTTLGRKV